MHRRKTRKVAPGDSYAVLVKRRTVNTYCRALPRQVVEKHHFLTPDTPVIDTMELPSRMLSDSTATSACSSRPISRLDGPNKTPSTTTQTVPSCNLDTVSMEMTCSTRPGSVGTATRSINDKLHFLKQTLAHELSRMSQSGTLHEPYTATATPLSAPIIAQTGKATEEREAEDRGVEQDEASRGSMELESVHLMSCETIGDKSNVEESEGDIGTDCRGEGEGGGDGSSESEIEVPRGAEEGPRSYFSPETGLQPIHISPDLPVGSASRESKKKKNYSVDLQGLIGVSPTGSIPLASRPLDSSGGLTKSVGSCGKKRSRKTWNSPKTRATAAVPGKRRTTDSLTIKRKTKRRRQEKTVSASTGGVESSSSTSVADGQKTTGKCGREKFVEGVERKREGEGGLICSLSPVCSPSLRHGQQQRSSGETCLERHFNQLQITPILPPSHSPCAPHPPLTSTPIVQQEPSASKDISTRQPNQRYPITSTPILPSHTHHLPNDLTDILESEMRRENPVGQRSLDASRTAGSGMGSTTERLMDFEMMPYQASTVLDLSSLFPEVTSHPPTTTTTTTTTTLAGSRNHCQSKTILSRAWQKGVKNTRRSAPPPSKKTISSPSTTGRPKKPKMTKIRPLVNNYEDEAIESNANTNQTGTGSVGQTTTLPHEANRPEKTTKHQNVPNRPADKTDKRGPPMTTKRHRRRCIVPLALRRRPNKSIAKPRSLRKSLTPSDSSSFSARNYPECILVCHQFPAMQGSKVLSLSPHYSICRSSDQSSVMEDILTRPIAAI